MHTGQTDIAEAGFFEVWVNQKPGVDYGVLLVFTLDMLIAWFTLTALLQVSSGSAAA